MTLDGVGVAHTRASPAQRHVVGTHRHCPLLKGGPGPGDSSQGEATGWLSTEGAVGPVAPDPPHPQPRQALKPVPRCTPVENEKLPVCSLSGTRCIRSLFPSWGRPSGPEAVPPFPICPTPRAEFCLGSDFTFEE